MDSSEGGGEAKLCTCHLSVVTVPLFLFVDTLNYNIVVVCFDMTVYVYGLCACTDSSSGRVSKLCCTRPSFSSHVAWVQITSLLQDMTALAFQKGSPVCVLLFAVVFQSALFLRCCQLLNL